jgi:hypothetical protein
MCWVPLLGMAVSFDAFRALQRDDLIIADVSQSAYSIPFPASSFDLPLQVSHCESNLDADDGSRGALLGGMNPRCAFDNQFDRLRRNWRARP